MTGKQNEQEVVDKGFNDDELADIMNEIENLESDFESESHQSDSDVVDELVSEDTPDPVEEVYKEDTEEVKEVVHALAQKPVEEFTHPKPEPVPAPVHHIHSTPAPTPEHKDWSPSGAQTSMSFKVEGDMKLSMSFWVSGKEFKVWVDEAHGFTIELDGGAQFKVPISHPSKKVA